MADCHAAATRAGAARRDEMAHPMLDPDTSLIGSFTAMRARYLIDTQEWAGDVAGLSVPAGNLRAVQITGAFVDGVSAVQRGQIDAASESLDRLKSARAEVLLAAGRPQEARAAFGKAMARTPGRTSALMGLLRAAEKLDDRKKAADVKAQLRAIWRRADRAPDLGSERL